MTKAEVCIRGSGAVGLTLALALARQGLHVGVVGLLQPSAAPASDDIRAYALSAASRALLQSLRVWDALPADAVTPVHDMQIQGDAPGGSLQFSAWQQGAEALAWIVDAAELDRALAAAAAFAPHVQRLDEAQAKTCGAALTVLAEGKASTSRDALGVQFQRHAYGHSALAARVVSSLPHAGLARQWFASPDVLALLPIDRPQPGHSFGLVWSMPADQAQTLQDAPQVEFEQALLQATGGAAGPLRLQGARSTWPLALARAEPVSGAGWVLVGDAAHLVHPLAGQGLNLGLADVATLARVLAEREAWRALDDEVLLRRYARQRALPNAAMGWMTDGLWRLFAQPHPAWRELRNRGLSLLNHLPPLKRALAARAMDS